MKRRTGMLLLALALALTLLPQAARADSIGNEVAIDGTVLDAEHPYWKNGGAYGTAENWNAHFIADQHKLVLKDARLTKTYASTDDGWDGLLQYYYNDSGTGALTVELIGDNRFVAAGAWPYDSSRIDPDDRYAVGTVGANLYIFNNVNGNPVRITGEGSLLLDASAMTYRNNDKPGLTIASVEHIGISASSLTIDGGCDVTVKNGTVDDAYPFLRSHALETREYLSMHLIDGHTLAYNGAVSCGDLTVQGAGTSLTVQGGTFAVFSINHGSYAVNCDDLNVLDGAQVTVSGGVNRMVWDYDDALPDRNYVYKDLYESVAIRADAVNVRSGGSVTAGTARPSGLGSDAIYLSYGVIAASVVGDIRTGTRAQSVTEEGRVATLRFPEAMYAKASYTGRTRGPMVVMGDSASPVEAPFVKITAVPEPTVTGSTDDRTVTAVAGETMTMTVTAANATGYQWQIHRGSRWENIDGATQAQYTTAAVTLDNDGYLYRCIISGAAGTKPAVSPVFTLRAVEQPEVPNAGDAATPLLWLGAAVLAGAAMAACALLARRKRHG